MADLVVGDNTLFDIGQDGALLFRTGNDNLEGGQQVLLIDGLAAHADGTKRRLVDEVCKVRTNGARRCLRQLFQIDILGQLDIACVDDEGLIAALQIRAINHDAAVKAARTEQRLVQDLRTVRRGKDDDALGRIEAVDLGQKLVQGLLPLIVAAEAAVAAAADGVDLVDKDNRGSDLRGLLKQIADAACADADEHFHEVRAGDGEERHVRLTRDRLGQQGFAGAGRADEQRALRELRTRRRVTPCSA